jgi:hypothetical protein
MDRRLRFRLQGWRRRATVGHGVVSTGAPRPGVTHVPDNRFDAIEVGLRERIREFIQAMIESELETALPRPR